MTETDVVIIGAGHNGLTCAAYLDKWGLRGRVVDRRKVAGGAAVTEEFCPGFRNSVASYTVSLLNPKIIADLALADHGLRIGERRAPNLLPAPAEFPAPPRRQLSPHRRGPHQGVGGETQFARRGGDRRLFAAARGNRGR